MTINRLRVQSALVLLGLLVLLVAAASGVDSSAPPDSGPTAPLQGDPALFSAVVERIRAGESYYPAMSDQLRLQDYPTASVFNWRTPALYVLMTATPRWFPFTLMATLAGLVLTLLMVHLARHGSLVGTPVGLAMCAMAVGTVANYQGRWMTDGWGGLLIGLSLAAYLWRWFVPAALVGLAALFIRELAAPYCIVCFLIAARARRRQELGVWIGGLLIFSLYYAMHVSQVLGEVRPDDMAHAGSWIQFGGFPFWLSTLGTNIAFAVAPRFVLAVASVLLVAALWDPDLPIHVRWSVVAYGLFFAVAGQPFNAYWGFLSAVAYALALAHGPNGLSILIKQTLPARI